MLSATKNENCVAVASSCDGLPRPCGPHACRSSYLLAAVSNLGLDQGSRQESPCDAFLVEAYQRFCGGARLGALRPLRSTARSVPPLPRRNPPVPTRRRCSELAAVESGDSGR